jgi:hypothetical protein
MSDEIEPTEEGDGMEEDMFCDECGEVHYEPQPEPWKWTNVLHALFMTLVGVLATFQAVIQYLGERVALHEAFQDERKLMVTDTMKSLDSLPVYKDGRWEN